MSNTIEVSMRLFARQLSDYLIIYLPCTREEMPLSFTFSCTCCALARLVAEG
jgi:hypothetical protein